MKSVDWSVLVKHILDGFILSQKELADLCGVTQQTVSNWVKNNSSPGSFARRKLLDIVENSLDRINDLSLRENEIRTESELPAKNVKIFAELLEQVNSQVKKERLELLKYQEKEELFMKKEAKYRSLLEAASDAIFIAEAKNWRIIDCNEKAEKLIGYNKSEILGINLLKMHLPAEHDRVKQSINDLINSGEISFVECNLRHKDGNTIPVEINANAILNEDGTKALFGIFRDIRKRSGDVWEKEKLLRACLKANNSLFEYKDDFRGIEEALKILGEAAGVDRICVFENRKLDSHRDLLMNARFEWKKENIKTGPEKSKLQELSCNHFFPDWKETFAKNISKSFLIKDFNASAKRFMNARGIKSLLICPIVIKGDFWGFISFENCSTETPWSISKIEILSEVTTGIGGTVMKILAEKIFKENELRSSTLLKFIPDLIFLQDQDGNYLDFAAFEKEGLLIPPEHYIGKNMKEILPDGLFRLMSKAFKKVLKTNKMQVFEYHLEVNDKLNYFEARVIQCENNTVLTIVRDITERKRIEKLKDDISHISRHDLKTPLNYVVNIPRLLKEEGKFSEDQIQMLQMIEESGHNMLNTINLYIDMYRMEDASYKFEPKEIDAIKILDRILKELQILIKTRKLNVEIILQGKTASSDDIFMVKSEEFLCYSMIANLVKNALESSPKGKSITVHFFKTKKHSVLTVHNQGKVLGEVKEHFFEKYVTLGKAGGSGLGTYSIKLIAETHGGYAEMKTSEREGTTVSVSLPL
jgi:PAS domain S-box-containing protein